MGEGLFCPLQPGNGGGATSEFQFVNVSSLPAFLYLVEAELVVDAAVETGDGLREAEESGAEGDRQVPGFVHEGVGHLLEGGLLLVRIGGGVGFGQTVGVGL